MLSLGHPPSRHQSPLIWRSAMGRRLAPWAVRRCYLRHRIPHSGAHDPAIQWCTARHPNVVCQGRQLVPPMIKLSAAAVLALASVGAAAASVAIGFDDLQSGPTYTEDGFLFSGQLTRDTNFGSAPSLRLYGTGPLTISRVDGGLFSLSEITILYRYIDAPGWYIENQDGQGFAFSRAGTFAPGQYPDHTMQNVRSLRIADSTTNGQNYYIFDELVLSAATSTGSIPEPPTLVSASLALGVMAVARRRFGLRPQKKTVRTGHTTRGDA